jgi:hypothetical protein
MGRKKRGRKARRKRQKGGAQQAGGPEPERVEAKLAEGKWSEAVKLARRLCDSDPSKMARELRLRAYLGRAEQLVLRGREDEAAALLDTALEDHPGERERVLRRSDYMLAWRGDVDALLAPLADEVCGERGGLRASLKALDRALGTGRRREILKAVREARRACERERPDLLEELIQRISIACASRGYPVREVRKATGRSSRKDSRFGRLYARQHEMQAARTGNLETLIGACACWQEAVGHAVAEGVIEAGGPEEAAVYLHVATLLADVPEDMLQKGRLMYRRKYDVGLRVQYEGQSAEIRAVDCEGDPFDLERMTVVDVQRDARQREGTVLEVVRPGYERDGEVIRFAQVRVAGAGARDRGSAGMLDRVVRRLRRTLAGARTGER